MLSRLHAIPDLEVSENVPLSECTRFAIGGPARWLVDVSTEAALAAAIAEIHRAGVAIAGIPFTVIGGGTNLIVADEGFPGVVLRYTASDIDVSGTVVRVESGTMLQSLVDFSIERGLGGLETMTGIPGWVGGAIYGNAGAYGHSIQERVEFVRVFDGSGFRDLDNTACGFAYRDSVFKHRKNWIVTSAALRLTSADSAALRNTADGILRIRNEKYPPTMRCAGSIFKNLILAQLPERVREQIPTSVIREGKVPSAYFLEQAGAKGMVIGGIRVADYHANLIYNSGDGSSGSGTSGNGSSAEVRQLIQILKSRVRNQFGLDLEEEVQYVPQLSEPAIPSPGG
jgi:UDP-N-acetylmuramate dehydrogenase